MRGLTRRPIFVPSVGNFRQGMLVSVPLHLDLLPGKPLARDLEAALAAHYARDGLVRVVPVAADGKRIERLEPEALNDTDRLELRVFGQRDATRRRCWSPGSTISARAPPARPCRTSA